MAGEIASTSETNGDKGHEPPIKPLNQLAKQAADAFVSGNVIGGWAIASLIALMATIGVLSAATEKAIPANLAIVGGCTLGILSILFAGASMVLYLIRVKARAQFGLAMMSGIYDITAKLTEKIRPELIAANDINRLAESTYKTIEKLLADFQS
jgi:hypothetical protein